MLFKACTIADIDCPEELVGVDASGLAIPDTSAVKVAAMSRLIKAAEEQFVVKEAAAVCSSASVRPHCASHWLIGSWS